MGEKRPASPGDLPASGDGIERNGAHHDGRGRFRVPWPVESELSGRGFGAFFRWQMERLRRGGPRRPPPERLPIVASDFAHPRAPAGEVRVTWIGHASFLVQIAGANLLVDPVWSMRASPVPWAGPARIVRPGVSFDDLPPIDAVLITHDHYDHLDARTVRRIVRRYGDEVHWLAPLGHAAWLSARGVRTITELDWHHATELPAGEGLTVTALPAQHWTQRSARSRNQRLWCSWALAGADGARVYLAGDSGWFDGYGAIGAEHGPFEVSILPIGAYAPRWFMRPFHMSPEEAVDAWLALGARGSFVPMHWGTFILSDEPVLEPPDRLRREWLARGLSHELLRIPAHGETIRVAVGEEAGTSR